MYGASDTMIPSAIEAIKLRTSVRTYQARQLETQALQALRDLCQEPRRGPFGNAVRCALISLNDAGKSELKQLGTYGMIKGAPLFLAGAIWAVGEDFHSIALLQHALGVITAVLAYLMGKRLFSPLAGLIGGGIGE